MGLMTDEPLIDDSELDEFNWDAYPITQGGNTMSRYHHIMLVANLCASAVAFKLASWFLGRAVHHKSFGHHVPTTGGITFADEDYSDYDPEVQRALFAAVTGMYPGIGKSETIWTEADPCSDYDPVHPDYRP